ncbi:hypothetical protein MMU07_05645 [Aquiflexum sp. LQ15W]|uniref:hypothetical protein n=1 Tax=Cognataquiflexum nitidum TaxID=2922272 RepID=UPI001F1495FA|nr:hypothetical protein [Cognataquiflexum nitidum]MCH6199048.1 hypothetical protein [Cognataquiflexum nitidum]
MKIFQSLIFAPIFFLTLSCNFDDKDFTQEDLQGIWELSRYQAESQLFFVDTYVFNEDGTFENRATARQQDSNDDTGINSLISGTYSMAGNKLFLQETEFLTLPEGSTIWHTSLDNLVGSDWNRETEITISMQDRRSQLVLDFGPCAPNELCTGPITYFRK